MDDQQNLDSQSLRDRAWTTDEIRKYSSNWTLAGDVGLFNLLNEFSHNIISRTHEVENAVDFLVHQTKMTSAKINNVINDFHMLSNLQFVENRVYDEEIQEQVKESKPVAEKTKEQRESEMLPKIMKAIELGLAVLDTQFDRINVNEISDSEDEDISSEGRTILEPKDPYENRSLPYIIGSEEFMKCDYAGLKDLVEEDVQSFSEESSISETDETSSDEGEPLPLDDDKFSEKQSDKMSQNISDRVSSSDESELFGSEKEVNGYASDTSLDFKSKEKNIQRPPVEIQPVKEIRQNSVSSLQSKLKLPQVLPVPKLAEKKKEEDLFTNQEENSDDESPFRKKTGLFASEIRFDDEKDGDLFGGDLFEKSISKEVKEDKPIEVPKASSKKPQTITPTMVSDIKQPALFDNDEDSEDDIFNTLMKTNKSTSSKAITVDSQDSSEKADTSSTPSSAPSIKSSGNAFDFVSAVGSGGSLFGDDSDGDDLFASRKTSQGKKIDFDTPEEEDLFGINAQPIKETKVTTQTKPSLFEDNKVPNKQPKKEESKKSLSVKIKANDSIFADSDSSDQEKPVPYKSPITAPIKAKKEPSLFDDDDFEDDIFAQATQKKTETTKAKRDNKKLNLFEEKPKQVSNKESTIKTVEKPKAPSIFEDTEKLSTKISEPVKTVEKSKNLSLFEDDIEDVSVKADHVKKETVTNSNLFQDDSVKESPKSVPRKDQTSKSLSLFEDSDNFDLFAPKTTFKEAEPLVPVPVSAASESTKILDEVEGAVTSKVSSPAKDTSTGDQISFDTSIDSSNVLNVINKGRVKITTKRRKPTRQGRLAALENSEKEAEPVKSGTNIGVDDNGTDSLFSASVTKPEAHAEAPKLDHKSQEKEKMNLMSQLISEVATSKIRLKKAAEKVETVDDDDVDIFSEAAKKDRSKSSFSFLPPEQNGIASMFPVEKEEEIKEDLNISKSDSFDDDFFTEPAFQNFRSSISHKDPILDLEDDDDDEDLFSTIKTSVLPKPKPETSDSNDLFDDDTDIFADVQKEKYEMFPNQVYEDEDDDIFGSVAIGNKSSSSSKVSSASSVKKVETQQVNAFDDPLTGLLGDD